MPSKPLIACFMDDIDAVVDKYRDQGISFAEAIGALEAIKLDIYGQLCEQQDSEEDV